MSIKEDKGWKDRNNSTYEHNESSVKKNLEEVALSVGLYNKLKRKGINFTCDINKIGYSNLTKAELIELLEIFADYRR